MKTQQTVARCSLVKWVTLFLLTAILIPPHAAFADPLVFVRTIEEMDSNILSALKDAKLSAALKMDKNGDMVVRCFDVFSVPVSHQPFSDKQNIQKLIKRTTLQVDQKGRGVIVKLAFKF
jgi:hypothetical protein